MRSHPHSHRSSRGSKPAQVNDPSPPPHHTHALVITVHFLALTHTVTHTHTHTHTHTRWLAKCRAAATPMTVCSTQPPTCVVGSGPCLRLCNVYYGLTHNTDRVCSRLPRVTTTRAAPFRHPSFFQHSIPPLTHTHAQEDRERLPLPYTHASMQLLIAFAHTGLLSQEQPVCLPEGWSPPKRYAFGPVQPPQFTHTHHTART